MWKEYVLNSKPGLWQRGNAGAIDEDSRNRRELVNNEPHDQRCRREMQSGSKVEESKRRPRKEWRKEDAGWRRLPSYGV